MQFKLLTLGSLFLSFCLSASAQSTATAITYQGRLNNGTNPVTGNYDLTFSLYNAYSGGTQVSNSYTSTYVGVTNGLFTTMMDFGGAPWTGQSLWLQIQVRTNGNGTFSPLTPRQTLTPTPYAIYATSASNVLGTVAAAQISGTVPAADLNGVSGTGLTGVALLAGGNNFTGNQTVNGTVQVNGSEQITGASGVGFHADENIGPNTYFVGEEHGINFNYAVGGNIGSLIMGYNGQGYFSMGNFYGIGSGTKAFTIFGDGNVNVDPMGMNSGVLNNGNTNSSGLTFGTGSGMGSGEGIASQRTGGSTATGQFGLEFYTDFKNRMTILQNGNVGIGTTSPSQALEVNGNYALIDGGAAANGSGPIKAYIGSMAGSSSVYIGSMNSSITNVTFNNPNISGFAGLMNITCGGVASVGSVTCLGSVGIGTGSPSQALEVNGNFALIDGATVNGSPIQAYIGGNGSGSEVQIGSFNPSMTGVAFWNQTSSAWMHISCSSITIKGGADLAEPFDLTAGQGEVSEGSVLVIDEANPGHLKLSCQPYDARVAGVVSGANGVHPGIQMQQQGLLEGGKNVALTGRVYVQADTSNGAIKPGDLLTSSSTPGRAMKVSDHVRAQGAILGKAMTALSEGHGMVLVLVTLQ